MPGCRRPGEKEQETIGSQLVALRAHAERLGLEAPAQWVFCDDGHSGATLVRLALEKLRDLVAQVPVDVVLVYSPDRLARKYVYQALLIEEFARVGSSVMFVKGPSSDSPEDALLVRFQGMIAEYERAQIIERTLLGKTPQGPSRHGERAWPAPTGIDYPHLIEAQHTTELADRIRYSQPPDGHVPRQPILPGIATGEETAQ